MSNLSRRWTWKRWAPDIGENRELEGGPVLFLELATGLTSKQMVDLGAELVKVREVKYSAPEIPEGASVEVLTELYEGAKAKYLGDLRAAFGAALKPYVRVCGGPHTVDGEQLATLDDYLRIIESAGDLGTAARLDLEAALGSFNGLSGADELFLPRSSGGARSTDARRTAKAAPKTASP